MLIAAICTGNTCRSPMLEAFLHRALEEAQLSDQVSVLSAGVAANDGDPASSQAQQVMNEYGIDVSKHRARAISHVDLPRVDVILTMSDRHAAILSQLGAPSERILIAAGDQGGVPDPFGGSVEDYRRTAVVLQRIAQETVTQIKLQRRQ